MMSSPWLETPDTYDNASAHFNNGHCHVVHHNAF
jgi:hypothetical protein